MRSTMAERPNRQGQRLDQPRETYRPLFRAPTFNPETFGRASERFARFMGTATFLVYMTGFIILWIALNTLAPENLRYAAPLILLSQSRQADRDRVALEQDRARDERNLADTEYLTREVASLRIALREIATRDFVRSELRSMLDEMEQRGMKVKTHGKASGSGERPPTANGDPKPS